MLLLFINFFLPCRPDGFTFTVPSEAVDSTVITKSGDVVSFTFDDFSKKSAPTNPMVYRIRTDITWENILATEEEIAPVRGMLFYFSSYSFGFFYILFLYFYLLYHSKHASVRGSITTNTTNPPVGRQKESKRAKSARKDCKKKGVGSPPCGHLVQHGRCPFACAQGPCPSSFSCHWHSPSL